MNPNDAQAPPTYDLSVAADTNAPITRTLPQSTRAERALIGCILLDSTIIRRADVSYLQVEHFSDPQFNYQAIWSCLLLMDAENKAINSVTLIANLGDAAVETMGGPQFILSITQEIQSINKANEYALIIWNTWSLRDQYARALKVADLAANATMATYSTNMEQMQQLSVGAPINPYESDGFVHISVLAQEEVDRLDAVSANPAILKRISTGFAGMDSLFGGFAKGRLHILAARPGMGKSALATGLGLRAVSAGYATGLISLEMGGDELTRRIFSTFTKIDTMRLDSADIAEAEWTPILEAASKISELPFYISSVDNTSNASHLSTIRTKAISQKAKYGLDLLIIDYLQLITLAESRSYGGNMNAILETITRTLKLLALELQIPILLLSQLSRGPETRTDKRPMLSDLRNSGAIEQDADVVMFIYREDYYDTETHLQNIAEIIFAKVRGGRTGTAQLYFRKELTQFSELQLERTDLVPNYDTPPQPRTDYPPPAALDQPPLTDFDPTGLPDNTGMEDLVM